MSAAPATPAPSRGARHARAVVVAPIHLYQRVVSPLLGPRCKYEPSCSHYAAQAVQEFGILRGLILAGWRLLRCNPWSYGGYDPVHEQRVFGRRRTRRTRCRAAEPAAGDPHPSC